MVAGGGEAEAQLLLRQAVLVADVELLKGLAERVLYLAKLIIKAVFRSISEGCVNWILIAQPSLSSLALTKPKAIVLSAEYQRNAIYRDGIEIGPVLLSNSQADNSRNLGTTF